MKKLILFGFIISCFLMVNPVYATKPKPTPNCPQCYKTPVPVWDYQHPWRPTITPTPKKRQEICFWIAGPTGPNGKPIRQRVCIKL